MKNEVMIGQASNSGVHAMDMICRGSCESHTQCRGACGHLLKVRAGESWIASTNDQKIPLLVGSTGFSEVSRLWLVVGLVIIVTGCQGRILTVLPS
jgi:hypothetical protein